MSTMNLRQKLFLPFVLFFLPIYLSGQIGGLSASKINSYHVDPVPKNNVEFEPTLSSSKSSSFWDEKGNKISLDSTAVSSNIQWRISFGLSDKTEIGLSTSPNIDGLSLGAKTILYGNDKLGLAGMLGLNIPFGNRTFVPSNPSINDISSYAFGFIGTYQMKERSSLDLNFTFQDFFDKIPNTTASSWILSADYGLFNKESTLLYMVSGYFQHNEQGNNDSSFFILSPGISVETANNFAIAINSNHTLFGKNTDISHGIALALTLFIN